jgi:hypothetical protein
MEVSSFQEAGSNTSTVALWVVGGDENGTQATLFLGDINTGTWPSRLGESRIWDSKTWSRVPRESDLRMTALARASSDCKYRPILSSETGCYKRTMKASFQLKQFLVVSIAGLVAKMARGYTASRKATLTLSLTREILVIASSYSIRHAGVVIYP